jgi:hypothetical protein
VLVLGKTDQSEIGYENTILDCNRLEDKTAGIED